MRSLYICIIAAIVAVSAVNSASIFDAFSWDGWFDFSTEDIQQQRNNEPSDLAERSCACEGPSCNCCLDFNLTFIDLGGPACVRMKYVSPADGIAVNISYGNRLLHSENVKGNLQINVESKPRDLVFFTCTKHITTGETKLMEMGANPDPTCIDMLSDLAQLCARFSDLAPTNDGLRWCLQLEPTLLAEVQAQYQVGCFRIGPEGMSVNPPIANITNENSTNTEPTTPAAPTPEELNEEALIAAVNESAEEGIAFFSHLLGINFGGAEFPANTTDANNTTEAISTSTTTTSTENPTEEQTETP